MPFNLLFPEEVILAEERTTEEEKMHIMEGLYISRYLRSVQSTIENILTARRRAAAKRKKLKNLGKSKSTDTEEEDPDEDCADDGKYTLHVFVGVCCLCVCYYEKKTRGF